MKTRIALAAGLLLTVGTAVAGTLIYGTHSTTPTDSVPGVVTPELIAVWRAKVTMDDYIAPKVPI